MSSRPPAIPEPERMTWEQLDLAVRARLDWCRESELETDSLAFSQDEVLALWSWACHHYRRSLPRSEEEQKVHDLIRRAGDLMKPSAMTAAQLTVVIREWLDASPATEWGTFERGLHAALGGEP